MPSVYPLLEPGEDVPLHAGAMTVSGTSAEGRLWMSTTGDVAFRWRLEPVDSQSLPLGETCLAFEHPVLGALELPARVTSTAGTGIVTSMVVGADAAVDHVVVHWMNVSSISPAEPLQSAGGTWAGRWSGQGGGWSFVLDSRQDLAEVTASAKGTPFHVVTHTGVLRRTDRQRFSPGEAEDGLGGLQVALSFALGRWVSPALAVGYRDGTRTWELWATWRCDAMQSVYAWWDTHTGDDLRSFVSRFMDAWADPLRRDAVRHVAHHIVESNRSSMTMEARIMLAGAALEYLSWVTYVVGGLRTANQHPSRASDKLRELLVCAGIPTGVPQELEALARLPLPAARPQDGPEAVTRVRNMLVHPKDAQEPYRLRPLVRETWQLLMHYGELLLLHEVGYAGRYCARFPLGRWAHDTSPVPWATASGVP